MRILCNIFIVIVCIFSFVLQAEETIKIITCDDTAFCYNNPLDIQAIALSKTINSILTNTKQSKEPIPLLRVNALCWQRIFLGLKLLNAKMHLMGSDKDQEQNKIHRLLMSLNSDDLVSFIHGVDYIDNDDLLSDALDVWITYRALPLFEQQSKHYPLNRPIKHLLRKKGVQILMKRFNSDNNKKLKIVKEFPSRRAQYYSVYDRLSHLKYSPDGNKLISGSCQGIICVWNPSTRNLIRKLTDTKRPGEFPFFTPDGEHVIFLRYESPESYFLESLKPKNHICIYNTKTWRLEHTQKIDQLVLGLCCSPNGKVLVYGGNNALYFYDLENKEVIHTFPIDLKNILSFSSLSFDPKGTEIAISQCNELSIFDIITGEKIKVLKDKTGYINTFCYSPDGKNMAWGNSDGIITIIDRGTWKIKQKMVHEWRHPIKYLQYSPNGSTITSASRDLSVWDSSNGNLIHSVAHPSYVNAACYSPSGDFIATCSSKIFVCDFMYTIKKMLSRVSYEQSLLLILGFQEKDHNRQIKLNDSELFLKLFHSFDRQSRNRLRKILPLQYSSLYALWQYCYQKRKQLTLASIAFGTILYFLLVMAHPR